MIADFSFLEAGLVVCCLTTLATCFLTSYLLSKYSLGWGADKDEGVQKFHTKKTSRLGGIGILAGLLVVCFFVCSYSSKILDVLCN